MNKFWLVLAAAVLLGAPTGHGQTKAQKKIEAQMRSVSGAVTAADDSAVVGAVVQLKNTKTLLVRSFITQKNGLYYFHELSPDIDYELKADYHGASSDTKKLSLFDSRKDPVINLKLNNK